MTKIPTQIDHENIAVRDDDCQAFLKNFLQFGQSLCISTYIDLDIDIGIGIGELL